MTDLPFAYSLAHAECGWAWRIFDEDGETVAQGLDLSQSDAQASVERLKATVPTEVRGQARAEAERFQVEPQG